MLPEVVLRKVEMLELSRVALISLVLTSGLMSCTHQRDTELGGDRYLVSATGSSFSGIAATEQSFHQHAKEVATAHGFDSYKVIDLKSGFEPTPGGFRAVVRGTIQLYQGQQNTASSKGKGGPNAGGRGSGTAFAVTDGGILITNAHVVHECREITVRQADGTVLPAALLAADETNDLALIKIAAPTLELAQFRGSPDIRQGDNVIAIGFPLSNLLSQGTATTLTTGTVSALTGIRSDSRLLQLSAPIQPGNSGGPLLDQSGHVVAIVSSGLNAVKLAVTKGVIPENVNFAIKAAVMRGFMDVNGVSYHVAASERQMSTAEIGDLARKFTNFVICTF
jgi:S1-C subfamily serine protease